MSASLVGSEMCIRDRSREAFLHKQNGHEGKPRCPMPCGHIQKEAGGRSVSYTHLTLPTICSV
eukprot:1768371-Alexandrium_andersonii.AAC.1